MATVTITIPSMLATLIDDDRTLTVQANTVEGAVAALFERHPELKVHLLDERGGIREHVSLFHNDHATRTLIGVLGEGDTITVLQAVSGG